MDVVCTICSREKDKSGGRLPARIRYKGEHIERVGRIAEKKGLCFFILSGIYGFIPAGKPIPRYDYALELNRTKKLIGRVKKQLVSFKVKKIYFFSECKEGWFLYQEVLERASAELGVEFKLELLVA